MYRFRDSSIVDYSSKYLAHVHFYVYGKDVFRDLPESFHSSDVAQHDLFLTFASSLDVSQINKLQQKHLFTRPIKDVWLYHKPNGFSRLDEKYTNFESDHTQIQQNLDDVLEDLHRQFGLCIPQQYMHTRCFGVTSDLQPKYMLGSLFTEYAEDVRLLWMDPPPNTSKKATLLVGETPGFYWMTPGANMYPSTTVSSITTHASFDDDVIQQIPYQVDKIETRTRFTDYLLMYLKRHAFSIVDDFLSICRYLLIYAQKQEHCIFIEDLYVDTSHRPLMIDYEFGSFCYVCCLPNDFGCLVWDPSESICLPYQVEALMVSLWRPEMQKIPDLEKRRQDYLSVFAGHAQNIDLCVRLEHMHESLYANKLGKHRMNPTAQVYEVDWTRDQTMDHEIIKSVSQDRMNKISVFVYISAPIQSATWNAFIRDVTQTKHPNITIIWTYPGTKESVKFIENLLSLYHVCFTLRSSEPVQIQIPKQHKQIILSHLIEKKK